MFITRKEYDELVKKADSAETKEDPRLEQMRKTIEVERKDFSERLRISEREHQEEIDTLQKNANNLKEDNKIIVARKDLELENKISVATNSLKAERDDLKMKLNNSEKEVSILTKAFSNLGFDVKDMKSILDKLVDGIVSKNTINLVK